MPEMGNSVDLIRKDGFPISAEVDLSPKEIPHLGLGQELWQKVWRVSLIL